MGKFIFDCLQSNNYCAGNNNAGQWEGYTTKVIALSDDWLLGCIVPAGPSNAIQYNAGDQYLGGDGGLTVNEQNQLNAGENEFVTKSNFLCTVKNGVLVGKQNKLQNFANAFVGGYNISLSGAFGCNTPSTSWSPSSASSSGSGNNVLVLSGDGSLGSQSSCQNQYFYYFDRCNGNPLNPSAATLTQLYFESQYIDWYNNKGVLMDTPMTLQVVTNFPTSTGMFSYIWTNSGNNPASGGGQSCGNEVWGYGQYRFCNGTRVLSTPEYTTWCFDTFYLYNQKRRYLRDTTGSGNACYLYDDSCCLIGCGVCINSPLKLELSASLVYDPSAIVAYNLYPGWRDFYMFSTYMQTYSSGVMLFNLNNCGSLFTFGACMSGYSYSSPGTFLNYSNRCMQFDNNTFIGGNAKNKGYPGTYQTNIGGDQQNCCDNPFASIMLGGKNHKYNYYQAMLGGERNQCSARGGCNNCANSTYYEPILGGSNNCPGAIGGSYNGRKVDDYGQYRWRVAIGGTFNSLYDFSTIVWGGSSNYATNSYGTVWGGAQNGATYGLTMGGECNANDNGRAFIAGGCNNRVTNNYPVEYYGTSTLIGAGYNNVTRKGGHYGSILAGHDNVALSGHAHLVGSSLSASVPYYTYTQNVSAQCKTEADGLNVNSLSAGKAICNPSTTYTGMFLTVNVAGSALLLPLYS